MSGATPVIRFGIGGSGSGPPASRPASIGKRANEPVGEEIAAGERSPSTSAVSRAFAERTRQALSALMFHPLADPRRDSGPR